MSRTVGDAVAALRVFAPEEWAEEWDNVGLQFGREDAPLRRILVCLDVTETTLAEARAAAVDLIVAHHPALFRPPKSLREDRPEGRLIAAHIRSGCAFYAAHTNVDVAPGGTNDALAAALGLVETRPLAPSDVERQVKLVVFTPRAAMDVVMDAMAASAAVLGAYSHCAFRGTGTGTFQPLEGAHPAIGAVGRVEQVEEERVEVRVERRRLEETLKAVRAVHPYEEIAYDVYPVETAGAPRIGLGRVGRLPEPMSLSAFADHVKARLQTEWVEVTRGADPVRTVAVCGGSGGSLVEQAAAAGAEVFVTSEIGHHRKLLARSLVLSLVEASHAATERPVVHALAEALRLALPNVEVQESGVS